MKNLKKLKDRLTHLKQIYSRENYHIPGLWVNPLQLHGNDIKVNAFDFFIKKIDEIYALSQFAPKKRTHLNSVYNMLVRYTCAYDHNSDGKVEIGTNAEGFRETGTFLKAIALLPYIHSLGCDTIYLLPVTSIGQKGRKGNLGSPYAIADPYVLDKNLSEPILEMNVETEFAAFVEAAHLTGMKVVIEFVFRTASIDSPLALEHPEWFYWIRDDVKMSDEPGKEKFEYGPPRFDDKTLKLIKEKINNNNYSRLPAPDKKYREIFTETPVRVFRENGYIKGITKKGIKCKIPSAFADWPPDDNQPLWTDVTYLKMYDYRRFNYIAYNTIRMYDTALAKQRYAVKSLWTHIEGIIPHYQDKYGIDGVMIDMGHALPKDLLKSLIEKARKKNKDFILWEENFSLSETSHQLGFDATLGYMPFDQHIPEKMKNIVKLLAYGRSPIPFFLTPETHNTKRAAARPGHKDYSKYAFGLNVFLPGLLFIHSGFELGETCPVNTGLQFTQEEIAAYPPEKLPLFSVAALNWTENETIIPFMRKILHSRQMTGDIQKIFPVDNLNPKIISIRIITTSENNYLLLAAPFSTTKVNSLAMLDNGFKKLRILETNETIDIVNNELLTTMQSHEITLGLLE